jgi:hypothetical protein
MRLTIFAAMFAFLLWGAPAFAGSNPDFDGDGVGDVIDNCSEKVNSLQDDTDGDDCGNLCDADYTQDGIIGFPDFGQFSVCFNVAGCALQQHTEPVDAARVVSFADFGYFATVFNVAGAVGPSGTTAGTVACP